MDAFEFHKALALVFEAVAAANRHCQTLEPWRAEEPQVITRAFFWATETLRVCGILLQCVMPSKAAEMLDRLGVATNARTCDHLDVGNGGARHIKRDDRTPLFPRPTSA